MIWYEVIEDLGDGTNATRRFQTEDEAKQHVEDNEEYCSSGYKEVDTDTPYFWYNR